MGEGIKVGGYNPIIIDGVEFKDVLNLSTKWQWVDDVGTQEISADYFVSHKNKIHAFSGKNHYRLDGDVWVADISSPVSVKNTTQLCSDDDYLYLIDKFNCYRFDGTAFTLVCTIPTSYTNLSSRGMPAVDKANKRLYTIFAPDNGSTSINKRTEAICGYINLQALTWNTIATHPYPDGTDLFMLNGELYSVGYEGIKTSNSAPTKTTNIHKLNADSWTEIVSATAVVGSTTLYNHPMGIIPIDNVAYLASYKKMTFYTFNGTSLEASKYMPPVPYRGTCIGNQNKIHAFGSLFVGTSDSANVELGGQHHVLEKVLCLEV